LPHSVVQKATRPADLTNKSVGGVTLACRRPQCVPACCCHCLCGNRGAILLNAANSYRITEVAVQLCCLSEKIITRTNKPEANHLSRPGGLEPGPMSAAVHTAKP